MAFIDIALFLALVALVLYILVIVHVIPDVVGNLDVYRFSYILLIIAIFLFIVWAVIRFCEFCCSCFGRRERVVEIV